MEFRQRAPRPPLDAFVESVWSFRQRPGAHALEIVLPTGAAQLIVNLKEDHTRLYDPEPPHRCVVASGTVLAGARTEGQVIDSAEQEDVAGVAFRPGGAAAFFAPPTHDTAEADTPLDALWGRRATAELRERLLEAPAPEARLDSLEAALAAALRPGAMHRAVAYALAEFERSPAVGGVAAVADAVGLSAKRFIERFRAQVGMTPKRYCRVRRFQQAVALAHRGRRIEWARVALDCGYYDQAHLIRDFRAFSGLTPTEYLASRTEFPNHVNFVQSGGTGV